MRRVAKHASRRFVRKMLSANGAYKRSLTEIEAADLEGAVLVVGRQIVTATGIGIVGVGIVADDEVGAGRDHETGSDLSKPMTSKWMMT